MESVTSVNAAEVVSNRRIKMNAMDKRKFGYFVFGGMLIGAFLGLLWSANGNGFLGVWIGALAGTAIGWFGAAYFLQKGTGKKE